MIDVRVEARGKVSTGRDDSLIFKKQPFNLPRHPKSMNTLALG